MQISPEEMTPADSDSDSSSSPEPEASVPLQIDVNVSDQMMSSNSSSSSSSSSTIFLPFDPSNTELDISGQPVIAPSSSSDIAGSKIKGTRRSRGDAQGNDKKRAKKSATAVDDLNQGAAIDGRENGDASAKLVRGYGYERVKLALLKYKEINENLLAKRGFIIPTNNPLWPEEVWGMKLGSVINNIKSGLAYKEKKDELRELGLKVKNIDSVDYICPKPAKYGFDKIKLALLKYREIYGDVLVKRTFFVPTENAEWPEETWGMRLGGVLHDIKYGNSYKDKQDELTSLGFAMRENTLASGRFEFDRVKQAMLKFMEINGPVLVIQRFVIPSDNLEWPEELWGMKLGIVIKNIKYGNAYKDKLDELISLGLVSLLYKKNKEGEIVHEDIGINSPVQQQQQLQQQQPQHILLQPLIVQQPEPLPYIHDNMHNIHIDEDDMQQNEIV